MMAYRNNLLIFYHVPKTGGRWIEKAMRDCGLFSAVGAGRIFGEKEGKKLEGRPLGLRRQHSTPTAMLDRFKQNRFQFCFVRRPFEWYRSYWCYKGVSGRKDPLFPLDRLWQEDFQGFLRSVLDEYPDGFIHQVYKCFVGPENNWMDFVGRYERLAGDLVVALRRAGCDFDEDKLRSTPPVNASKAYPIVEKELVKAIEEAEHWVSETFYV